MSILNLICASCGLLWAEEDVEGTVPSGTGSSEKYPDFTFQGLREKQDEFNTLADTFDHFRKRNPLVTRLIHYTSP